MKPKFSEGAKVYRRQSTQVMIITEVVFNFNTNTCSYRFRRDNEWDEMLGKSVPEEDLMAVSPPVARRSNSDAQPSFSSLEGRGTRANLDPKRFRSAGTAGSIGHFACNIEPCRSAEIIRTFDRFENLRGHYANTHDWRYFYTALNVFDYDPSQFLGAPEADLKSKASEGVIIGPSKKSSPYFMALIVLIQR
jgi:hypothetical protein